MPEIIGDVVQPIELVIPTHEGTYIGKAGDLFLSGVKLWFSPDGTNVEIITSA